MTLAILPPARPDLSRADVAAFLAAAGLPTPTGPYLVGRRGYYRDTMGAPGRNDRGLYDDAIALVTPGALLTVNANTDPSVARPGIAVLEPGAWRYTVGIHHQDLPVGSPRRYEALVQAAEVTVRRDGGAVAHGWFGINIHHGTDTSTTSEGCQTIPPAQWAGFLAAVKGALAAAGVTTLPYLLTARPDAATGVSA